MRKFIICLYLCASCSLGFALPTNECEKKLQKSSILCEMGQVKEAIAFCTECIEDPTTSYRDKVHYIIARTNFHLKDQDFIGYQSDMAIVQNWTKYYPEVSEELFTIYEINCVN